jgi:hypothetical protein
VIWLKVLLALVVALLTAALMCLLIQGLVTGGEKAVGWLVRRARARKTPPVLVPSDGSHDALDEDPELDAAFDALVADLKGER